MTIRLFEVGGSIRDELMGIENPPDRDFCAESPEGWEALLKWCHSNMKKVFLVNPEFLTVRGMMPNGDAIDVVMCRADGPSSDGRHPDHVTPGTLLDDLARRDFTVNAMALVLGSGEPELLDLHGGQNDLAVRQLNFLHLGSVQDDPTRVVRGARGGP